MMVPQRQTFSLGRRGFSVTVVTLRAAIPGPTVLVTGNVHGDECTGVGACIELVRELPKRLLRGTVLLMPSLNPEGLERRSRRLPELDADLNRAFPGDDRGSLADRYAAMVWSVVVRLKPDLLVDLHADTPLSIPYVLVDRAVAVPERAQLEAESLRLAMASGLRVVWEYPEDRYVRFRLDRSLSGASLARLKIPALTIECGPRLYIDPLAVGVSVQGVLGMLRCWGMVEELRGEGGISDGEENRIHEGFRVTHLSAPENSAWRRESGPKNNLSGVMVPVARPGELVRRGEDVAEIWNLAGERLERVRAEEDCRVLSFVERAYVVAGTVLATVAVRDKHSVAQ